MDTGIDRAHREQIAEGLSGLLADSYTLYLQTHNYHWNVEGPWFVTLHGLFETHYLELADAVDVIAERIRALGQNAPGSYREFSALSQVQEPETLPAARAMVEQLMRGQEAVIRRARSLLPAAESAGDQVTADLLTQRMQVHEKNAWMLRSLLKD
jgi:starvation-inducible DNA-binding protein